MSLLTASQTYKPFKYPWAFDYAIQSDKAAWGEWEADLQSDVRDWSLSLTEDEKAHITAILKLFTQSDCQVAANYCNSFIPLFKNNEIRQMLLSFGAREVVHQR